MLKQNDPPESISTIQPSNATIKSRLPSNCPSKQQSVGSTKGVNTGRYSIDQFASSTRLPTLPEVAVKLIELSQQNDPDFVEVSRVIGLDAAVSGKVMTTVNSALLGFRPKVASINEAVNKLGINMIRTLLLSFHLAQSDSSHNGTKPILQAHWRSSLTQAVFAELIAEQLDSDPATYFLAAMLQDVGILAMVSEAPIDYSENVLTRCQFPDVAGAERSYFGFSHLDVSAAIVEKWGLGDLLRSAILHHHDEIMVSDEVDLMKVILRAASLGTTVVMQRTSSKSLANPLGNWCEFLDTHFKFDAEQANGIISEVNERVNEYSALFQFDVGGGLNEERIVVQAKGILQEIALANQMELISNKRAESKRQSNKLEMYLDALTGLYNRRYMSDHLADIVELSVRKQRPIGMLFLDVDKFKEINDTYGHSFGDQAICHVANWVQQSVRSGDIAFRFGGDEFLLVLDNIKESDFEIVANRIANQVPELTVDDTTIQVNLSIGGTFYKPMRDDIADPNWLINQSDQSMYDAKNRGGACASIQRFMGRQ